MAIAHRSGVPPTSKADLASRLASAAVDTGEALKVLTIERNRLDHSWVDENIRRMEQAESLSRKQRKILAAVVRLNARDLQRKGADLWTTIVALRTMVSNGLIANDVAAIVHESVLAEISTACVFEYYSAAHAGDR